MDANTRANGRPTRWKEMACFNGQMGGATRVSTFAIRRRGSGFLPGLMAGSTGVPGSAAGRRVKAFLKH